MKRSNLLILLVIFALAACDPHRGGECNQGICVHIDSSNVLGQDGSLTIHITVTSDIDRDDISVSLDANPGTVIDEPAINDGEIWNKVAVVMWKVKVKVNEPVVLTRVLHFPEKDGYIQLVARASTESEIRTISVFNAHLVQGTLVPNQNNQNFLNSAAVIEGTRSVPVIPTIVILETLTPDPTMTIVMAPTDNPEPTETPSSGYPPPPATPASLENSSQIQADSDGSAYPAP